MQCPYCHSKEVKRKGKRKTIEGEKQRFQCKECGKLFAEGKNRFQKYSQQTRLEAINHIALGHTLHQTALWLNKRTERKASRAAISKWHQLFTQQTGAKNNCPANPLEQTLVEKTYLHKGLAYRFQLHQPKARQLCKEFPALQQYLYRFVQGAPNKIFESAERISQQKMQIFAETKKDFNQANRIASYVLKGTEYNNERHSQIQTTFLLQDATSIAAEVPVWYWERNLAKGYCGHIDLVQIRNNKVQVLDFKPNAVKETKAPTQLYLYALALSFRTGIPLQKMQCAWFDEKNYYSFEPSTARAKEIHKKPGTAYPEENTNQTSAMTQKQSNKGD